MKALSALLALLLPSHLLAEEPAASAPPAEPEATSAVKALRCAGAEAGAMAGQLDPSFGDAGTGIARLRFGADDDGGFFDLAVAGGEIIAGGWGQGGLGGTRFRVARLTGSGAPDPSFGAGGMVLTSWAASTGDYVYLAAARRQRAGGTVGIGWRDRFRDASADMALARYTEDGSLDPGFGDGGKSLLDLGGDEVIRDGLIALRGGIVAVGQRDDRLLVARATEDGALDTSFARPHGYWTLALGPSVAEAVALDIAGRLVVVGSAERDGQRDMVVVRLQRNGALDPSFGDGGVVFAGDPDVDERAVAVAVSLGGGIVVGGDAGPEGARDFQVRRFLRDGSPDLDFGDGGVAAWPTTGGDDLAADMALLPDGAVLIAGNGGEGAAVPLLARTTCNGAPDPAFGEGGVLSVDLGEFGVLHTVRAISGDQVLLGGGDVGMTPGPGTYGVVARMWM
ncbi:hypothetical protein [Sorangium sp. So ce1078]|uniref:hypothetical protein n=1 Tax=Sorangium sp. So ce1078 TaxID=3133329 RepID=UPI003F63E17A